MDILNALAREPVAGGWSDRLAHLEAGRQEELAQRLAAWEPAQATPEQPGPFAHQALSGLEVYWLAVCAYSTRTGLDRDRASYDISGISLRHLPGFDDRSAAIRALSLPTLSLQAADLRGADLRTARLAGAHLEGAHLAGAALQAAHLRGTHLEGADLTEAHLEGADLRGVHLEGTTLLAAHLEGADLHEAHLDVTILDEAHLEGAWLRWSLRGASLRGAHLMGADLLRAEADEADLRGADLRGARCHATSFIAAHLEGANLCGATLQEADFTEAHLEGADLRGARVQGTTFEETGLADVRFSSNAPDLGRDEAIDETFRTERLMYANVNAEIVRRVPELRPLYQQTLENYGNLAYFFIARVARWAQALAAQVAEASSRQQVLRHLGEEALRRLAAMLEEMATASDRDLVDLWGAGFGEALEQHDHGFTELLAYLGPICRRDVAFWFHLDSH